MSDKLIRIKLKVLLARLYLKPSSLVFMTFGLLMACNKSVVDVEIHQQFPRCGFVQPMINVVDPVRLKTNSSPAFYLEGLDFERHTYILVAAGTKPTVGYNYEQIGQQAFMDGNKVVLPIRLLSPRPNASQLQMLTSPCVLLAVDKKETEKYLSQNIVFVLQDNMR